MAQTAAPRQRDGALDGLRGVAALGVVISHGLLASIPFRSEPVHDWLYPLWMGNEAVAIFFVLSGFVLTLPYLDGRRFDTAAYYVSRFARLYLPTWCALILAALLHTIVSWHVIAGASWWLNAHATPLTLRAGVRDATLFKGSADFPYFGSLWTLRWEIIFSVVLPAAIWLGSAVRAIPVLIVSLAVIVAGRSADNALTYLPVFMLGVTAACSRDRVTAAWGRATALQRIAVVAFVLACLTTDWWLAPAHPPAGVIPMLRSVGALGTVGLALLATGLRSALETGPIRWLGQRSFSLYLVHEPILVSFAVVTHARWAVVPAVATMTGLSLLGAEAFYRLLERPAHVTSRRLRAVMTGRSTAIQLTSRRA
jgi:peptidoglycan/LPS O-acetylase OafA/YrhL